MTKTRGVTIHKFDPANEVQHFDSEGDQMIGFYYQITGHNDEPISDLIGPYNYGKLAEKAALRAINRNDF